MPWTGSGPDVGWLGQTLTAEGRASEALPVLERGVDMAVAKFGADHLATADGRFGLGTCLMALGHYDKAEPELRAGYAVVDRKKRSQPRLFARIADALARVHRVRQVGRGPALRDDGDLATHRGTLIPND